MHHPPAHRDRQRHHAIEHARTLQPADAARGQCEIDGAAGSTIARRADRPPLVHGDAESALCQQDGEQRTREPGADDVDAAPASGSRNLLERGGEPLDELEHVDEPVIERRRRDADEIRLAPVADDAVHASASNIRRPRRAPPLTRRLTDSHVLPAHRA